MHMIIDLCPTIIISVFIIILGMVLFWYSEDRRAWFHIFIKQILDEKDLLFLFIISIIIMFLYGTYKIDIAINLFDSHICQTSNVLLTLLGGYSSGYIIYLLTIQMPKAKRKKAILSIIKVRLFNVIGEIENQMCGSETDNREKVKEYIKKYAEWNEEMKAYEINADNVKYYRFFMNSISLTINTILPYAEYLDNREVELIEKTMLCAMWYSEGLKDHGGKAAYPDEGEIYKLAEAVSNIYNNLVVFHSKLEKIV